MSITPNTQRVNTDMVKLYSRKKRLAVSEAARMVAAGYMGRGHRMSQCGDYIASKKCAACGKVHISTQYRCRDKMCPLCAWRLGQQRLAHMCDITGYIMQTNPAQKWYMMTLTVKNCHLSALNNTVKEMSRMWNRVTARAEFKRAVLGWARSLEITYSDDSGAHPHYHILLQVDNEYFNAATASGLILLWLQSAQTLTAARPAQDIRPIVQSHQALTADDLLGALTETYKYMVKQSDTVNMSVDNFRLFVSQISGLRACAFGGQIKAIKRKMAKDFELLGDEAQTLEACQNCGHTALVLELLRWSMPAAQYIPDTL